MTRYLIAIPLPMDLAEELRRRYQETYNDRLRVKFLHCTIIPPFTVESNESLHQIHGLLTALSEWKREFRFGKPGIFKRRRKILYLPVLDMTELEMVYEKVLTEIKPLVSIAASDFKADELPMFLPHLTLSYRFNGDKDLFVPPENTFSLPRPELLKEVGLGLWNPVFST